MRLLAVFGGLLVFCSPQETLVDHVDRVPAPKAPEASDASEVVLDSTHAITFVPLSHYETHYDRGGSRAHNIEQAAALLAFVPIEPGETFSFNEHVGPRDRDHDFWLAPVIANGELTDGLGGGVCQVSSTLHAAARLARLTVTERTPHTRSSSYIAPGMDATVVYPSKDLKLRNDGTSSVILTLRAQLGVLVAEVLSASPPTTTSTYSFKVGLTGRPSGGHTKPGCPTKLVQKGTDGHIVWSTLTSDDGSKTTWLSAYPPTDEVWQVCPSGSSSSISEKLP